MDVTAELGRRRMKVRDLARAHAGLGHRARPRRRQPGRRARERRRSIAHGEVVVIDEEFGIRISEIVAAEPMGAA